MVELALVIPILLFTVIGTVEVCELIFLNQSLKISAYEGARIAIVPDANEYDINYQVTETAKQRKLDGVSVNIEPANFQDLPMGEFITVEVTIDTSNRTFFSNLIADPQRSASVSMMKEH